MTCLLLCLILSGCGKKPQSAETPIAAPHEAAALPELAQNTLYLAHSPAKDAQETPFQPVSNEQQPVSQEERDLSGPPSD